MTANRMQIATVALVLNCAHCLSAFGEFAHPGIAHSRESIQFVKAKIADGQQPWLAAWERLKNSRYASLDWQPKPIAHVERGPYNKPSKLEFLAMTPKMRKEEGKAYVLPRIDGNTIDLNPKYAYRSPYLQNKAGSDIVTVSYGNRKWEYDFAKNTVTGITTNSQNAR